MSQVQTVETNSESASRAVIDAVAAAEDTSSTEVAPPLYDVVDPEALDQVFAGKTSVRKVVFRYNSYEVRVDADGYLDIEDHSG